MDTPPHLFGKLRVLGVASLAIFGGKHFSSFVTCNRSQHYGVILSSSHRQSLFEKCTDCFRLQSRPKALTAGVALNSSRLQSIFVQNPGILVFLRYYCSSAAKSNDKMTAKLISGTEVSKQIQAELKAEVARLKEEFPDFAPGLAIVQVGGREDSNVYIRMKIKSATEIGINANHVKFPKTITEAELLEELKKLNENPKVHGIIVQMPLDTVNPIDSHKITDAVDPSKDVDGLCTINEGRVAIGDLKSGFMPCTPYGCIELIKRTGVEIDGAKAVVLGRSKIVGTPVAELLKWHNATVTVCHSRTKNIADEVRSAEILVVGIGRPEMVKGNWVKPGAVVIDCGINSIPDASKKSGSRLVGDVDFQEVSQVAGYLTPVPGGVGPMTVCMLMKNTVISAKKTLGR